MADALAEVLAPPPSNGQGPKREKTAAEKAYDEEQERKGRVQTLSLGGWKVDLSGGHKATLCDPTEIPERKRRAFKNVGVAMKQHEAASLEAAQRGQPPLPPIDPAMMTKGDDLMIVMFLRDWDVQIPMPSIDALDPLQDLPGQDYDALIWACRDLVPDAFLDQKVSVDPASPFSVSNG